MAWRSTVRAPASTDAASCGWPPSPAPRAPFSRRGSSRAAWSQTPKKGGTLTVGINTDIVSLDPNDIVFANVPMFFQLYDYLVTFWDEPRATTQPGGVVGARQGRDERDLQASRERADALGRNVRCRRPAGELPAGQGQGDRWRAVQPARGLHGRRQARRPHRTLPVRPAAPGLPGDGVALGDGGSGRVRHGQAEGRRNGAFQARRVGSRRPPDLRPERQLLAARTALPGPGRLPGAERRRRDGKRVPRGPDRRGPHDPQQGRSAAQGRGPAGPAGPRPQRVLRGHPQHAQAALRQPEGPAGDAVPARSRDHREDDPGRHRQGAGAGGRAQARRPTTRSSTRSSPSTPRRPASSSRRRGSPARRRRWRARVDQHAGEPGDRSDHPGGPQEGRHRREPHHRRAVSVLPDLLRRKLRDLVPVPDAGDDRSDRLHDQLGLPAERRPTRRGSRRGRRRSTSRRSRGSTPPSTGGSGGRHLRSAVRYLLDQSWALPTNLRLPTYGIAKPVRGFGVDPQMLLTLKATWVDR